MNKKPLKLISMFLTMSVLLGCHSEKHLSPEMELGESVIIHNHQD
jgi:hypothetical protein